MSFITMYVCCNVIFCYTDIILEKLSPPGEDIVEWISNRFKIDVAGK